MQAKLQLVAKCNDGSATLAELEYLYENDVEITYESFARHVDVRAVAEYLGYVWGKGIKGLRLSDDYAVHFYKSKFRGKVCYHLDWSCIDHIFQ
jgi:hypothetical protein